MSDFDLNLTRVFVLLYETGSVTITADTLHVTQPTISYSLRKLRRHFDDVLFQRSGRFRHFRPPGLTSNEPHRLSGKLLRSAR